VKHNVRCRRGDVKMWDSISAVEHRYTAEGEPALGEAFQLIRQQRESEPGDREAALRLLFLSWYCCSEPPYLTGLVDIDDAPSVFREIYFSLGGADSDDIEFLFVAGYMASIFPYCCGEEAEWVEQGRRCLAKLRKTSGASPGSAVFKGRGAYGQFFAHIADRGWNGI
jgi:hypothetical protein